MSILQVNTFSQALSRIITFHIILPNDAPPEMLAGNSYYDRPMKPYIFYMVFREVHRIGLQEA